MEDNYISIKELAERVGRTQQSIYKRINKENNPIKPFVKKEKGQTFVDKVVIDLFYNKEKREENNPPIKPSLKEGLKVETENKKGDAESTASMIAINILKEQLEAQRTQIAEKDKQIESLNERLKESQKMLDQQQQLSALDKKTILQLEEENKSKAKSKIKKLFSLFSNKEAGNEQ